MNAEQNKKMQYVNRVLKYFGYSGLTFKIESHNVDGYKIAIDGVGCIGCSRQSAHVNTYDNKYNYTNRYENFESAVIGLMLEKYASSFIFYMTGYNMSHNEFDQVAFFQYCLEKNHMGHLEFNSTIEENYIYYEVKDFGSIEFDDDGWYSCHWAGYTMQATSFFDAVCKLFTKNMELGTLEI